MNNDRWYIGKYIPLMIIKLQPNWGRWKGSLICSICWLLWCQYSHHGQLQTTDGTSLSPKSGTEEGHEEPREWLQHIGDCNTSQVCSDMLRYHTSVLMNYSHACTVKKEKILYDIPTKARIASFQEEVIAPLDLHILSYPLCHFLLAFVFSF